MKGITICAECAQYDMKKHRCRAGASVETDPRDPFYDDCPLPDAEPVVHGRWINKSVLVGCMQFKYFYECSVCGRMGENVKTNYCPNCGAKMDAKDGANDG